MKTVLIATLIFSSSTLAATDCKNAQNTLQIAQCKEQQTVLAKKQMKQYLRKAKSAYQSQPQASKAIIESQMQWQNYAKAQCKAVYQMFAQGTIVSIMTADCDYQTVKQRTHDIWRDFLQTLSGDPLLPEPSK
ncbi:DUF1311 domain-containing protein [Shewanella sp. 202IG2-18]|uniref:lysozyme inhibitor LprI family protein n=1 Tax=Parashewanella hymeniacidonis TaxID=2807618 RepID=UPI0019621137|nr:lysozyme inhibitor LprI family protein [Parashewanella hymeniacidonis]MBM7073518.1 DUF1311 domain-containing protein [Parashewanella hymeniacidonis]